MKQDGFRGKGGLDGSVMFDETQSVTSPCIPESYMDRCSQLVTGINGIEDLTAPISPGDSLTYGDVFFANRLLRATSSLQDAINLIESGNVAASELLRWVRNDVVIAIDVVTKVADIRSLIICSG